MIKKNNKIGKLIDKIKNKMKDKLAMEKLLISCKLDEKNMNDNEYFKLKKRIKWKYVKNNL